MIQTIIGIIIAIFIFGIIVLVHEFGHFIVAKKFGVMVEEFSIGMGPRIFSKMSKTGTIYSIKVFPLGGSCSMMGEDEENLKEGSFNSIAMWKRMLIVFAGPFSNFVLAFVLSMIVVGTKGVDLPYVTAIDNSTNAYVAGLRQGDRITEYRNTKISLGRDLYFEEYISPISGDKISISFIRNEKKYNITFTPDKVEQYQLGIAYVKSDEKAKVTNVTENSIAESKGIKKNDIIYKVADVRIHSGKELEKYFIEHPLSNREISVTIERDEKLQTIYLFPQKDVRYVNGFEYNTNRNQQSFSKIAKCACMETRYGMLSVIKSLKLIITGKVSEDDISGPIGIVNTIGTTYKVSEKHGISVTLISLLQLSILLTANLGIVNLLPIPALDGGRLFIYLIQLVTRREVSKEKEGLIHLIGFALLMILMVFLTFNDIRKMF